ncbi:hypothetical protein H2248_008773 [Termitomyces sp. 'cryptogamus']|nr:hypothetical protein H2248_008773 [Termitomyces sp. 'cryptogamus']
MPHPDEILTSAASVNQIFDHLQNPLESWHPLEPDAQRSDFMVPETAQEEFREMRDVLKKQLSDLDKLPALNNDSKDHRRALINRLTEINAVLSPQKKLPPEILILIFSSVFSLDSVVDLPPRNPAHEYPWCLARTCGRWRQIIYSTQGNWKSIRIFYRSLGNNQSYKLLIQNSIKDVLSRGTHILDFRLLNWTSSYKTQDPLLDILAACAARITRVTIACPFMFSDRFLSSAPYSFPELESVELIMSFQVPQGPPGLGHRVLPVYQTQPRRSLISGFSVFTKAPKLHELSISSVLENVQSLDYDEFRRAQPMADLHATSIPFSQLTRLDIRGKTFLTITETHWLLSACKNLQTCTMHIRRLSLDRQRVAKTHDKRMHVITLQSLFTFEIHVDAEEALFPLLQPLALPSLTSLGVHYLHAAITTRILAQYDLGKLIRLWQCKLECLTHWFEIPPHLIDSLIYTISPSIRVLDISPSELSTSLLRHITSGFLLPIVEEIHVFIRSKEAWDTFVSMVEERWSKITDSLSTVVIYTNNDSWPLEPIRDHCRKLNHISVGGRCIIMRTI